MICEHCRNEIADTSTFCPACGMAFKRIKSNPPEPTGYGSYPHNYAENALYTQESTPAQFKADPFQRPPVTPYARRPYSQPSYQQPYYTVQQQVQYTTFVPIQGIAVSNKNDSALVAEIILSLFGIFGVGWLLAGETTVGIILLVCSIFVYWPLMILGAMFTFGVGLVCLGPLAIGAIILNAILLNNTLNRKALQFIVMHPSRPPIPPRPQ